jgi:hypothetical protein
MSRRLNIILSLTIALAAFRLAGSSLAPIARAQSPDQARAIISSPADGQQLFGLVNILGSAEHPTAFARYTLEYDDLSDPTVTWLLVQPAVQQQVHQSVLGTWNTNVVPDGVYRLRLRVFLDDGQAIEYIVSNLRVINRAPTPVPTIPMAEAAPAFQAVPPGPSPTSPIVQPPSSNPVQADMTDRERPAVDEPPDREPLPARQNTTRVNLVRVREAFCAGFYLAMGVFALIIIYSLIRRRPAQRRPWSSLHRWPEDWDSS